METRSAGEETSIGSPVVPAPLASPALPPGSSAVHWHRSL